MNIEPNFGASYASFDDALTLLDRKKQQWAQTPVEARLAILDRIRDGVNQVAQDWSETAARKKGLDANAPLAGEEWISGPYALMTYCNALMETLSKVAGKAYLKGLPMRELPDASSPLKSYRIPSGTACCSAA